MKRFILSALMMMLAVELSGQCRADDETTMSGRTSAQVVKSPLTYRYFRRAGELTAQESIVELKSPVEEGKDSVNSRSDFEKEIANERKAMANRTAKARNASGIWSRKSIHELRLDIRDQNSVVPADRSGELNYGSGDWNQFFASPKVFAWAAPNIHYQPLYFEDVALERYGQTTGCNSQPVRSAIHFFNSVVFLPNHVRHDHPQACDYPLGFCRPGSNVACTRQIQYLGRPQ